jgi:hypothetical protein
LLDTIDRAASTAERARNKPRIMYRTFWVGFGGAIYPPIQTFTDGPFFPGQTHEARVREPLRAKDGKRYTSGFHAVKSWAAASKWRGSRTETIMRVRLSGIHTVGVKQGLRVYIGERMEILG